MKSSLFQDLFVKGYAMRHLVSSHSYAKFFCNQIQTFQCKFSFFLCNSRLLSLCTFKSFIYECRFFSIATTDFLHLYSSSTSSSSEENTKSEAAIGKISKYLSCKKKRLNESEWWIDAVLPTIQCSIETWNG